MKASKLALTDVVDPRYLAFELSYHGESRT